MLSTSPYYAAAGVPGEYLVPFAQMTEADLEKRVAKFALLLAET